MFRRVFTWASAASLLLCVVTFALCCAGDRINLWHRMGNGAGVGFSRGDIGFCMGWRATASGGAELPCYTMPAGLAAFVLLLLPLTWLLGRDWKSAHPKPHDGHCPHCGYDLRASKHRCPECGTPIRSTSG